MGGVVVVNQPGVYLVDADGNSITVTDGLAIGSAEAILLAGKNGSDARFIRVATDGTVRIDPTGTTTQPVSAASLPLPAGAATSANQTNGQQLTIVRSGNKGTSVANVITSSPIDANVEALHVDGSNVTQPISAATLPLPTGAATEATLSSILTDTGQIEALLTTIDADTSSLDVALSTRATESTLSGLRSDFNAEDFASEATLVAVDAVLDAIYVRLADKTQFARITDGTNDAAVDASGDLQVIHTDPLPAGTNVLGKVQFRNPANDADMGDLTTPVRNNPSGNITATGAITALNGAVEIDTEGCAAVAVQVAGTWVGTVVGEYTIDGTTWHSLEGYEINGTAVVSSTQQNGNFHALVHGFQKMRVRASAFTSGTIEVDIVATVATGRVDAQIAQRIVRSTSNSSVSNLASGAFFTGAPQPARGVQAVGISIDADQPVRVHVEQSIDGANWDFVTHWDYWPARGAVAQQFAVQNEFVRVRAENRGGSTTTAFSLTTELIPIANILPPNLSPRGNLRATLIDDEHDQIAQFSAFGQLETANQSTLGDYRFNNLADIADEWTVTETGTGALSIENSKSGALLSTGASGSSKVEMRTIITHQYVSGRGNMYKYSVILRDTGVAGNRREWGFYDGNDGSFLRLNGTQLSWVIVAGGVETVIDAEEWDIPVGLCFEVIAFIPDTPIVLANLAFLWRGSCLSE
jgi:hypothetical protein